MFGKLRFAKRLFRDLPKHAKLAYCLLRDDRVSGLRKAAFGATLAVGLNPFLNLPEFVPVVGELDALAITLLALRVFIATTPEDIVDEHRRLLVDERSVFDLDLRAGERHAARITDAVTRGFRSNAEDSATTDIIELPSSTSVSNERQVGA